MAKDSMQCKGGTWPTNEWCHRPIDGSACIAFHNPSSCSWGVGYCFRALTHQSCGHLDCVQIIILFTKCSDAVSITNPLAYIHPAAVKKCFFVCPLPHMWEASMKIPPSVQKGEESGRISISRLGFSPMCHSECNCNVTLQGLHVGGWVVRHKREDCSQNTN